MNSVKYVIVRTGIACVALSVLFTLCIVFNGDAIVLRFAARHMEPVDAASYLATESSPVLLDRKGAVLYAFLADDEQWRFPVTLDSISPRLVQATLAVEDKRFRRHAGVDPRAVVRAAWHNLKARRYVSGASTLTMQLVKQHTPTPRTLSGKMEQALLAVRLDAAASKDALLKAYLNTAPYGRNLVGVEAAAQRFFGKSNAELTLAEAAMLAGLPKAPTAFDPLRRPDAALRRRNHVLQRMLQEKMITPEAHEDAVSRPLGAQWHDFPTHAPHLAMARNDEIRKAGEFHVTLDKSLQARLERLLPRYLKQYDNTITNAAIMVVDTRSGAVIARVGSADFDNALIDGQVDLCRAPRAPGSALKPFVYALALEQNRLYPSEGLLDNTLDYGAYNPANFDGSFSGIVSATEALQWSLNVPAVQVQQRAGVAETKQFLARLGIDTLHRTADAYGLGLVLGNCEVRLESLVEAYLALARLGEHTPLRLCVEAPPPQETRVLPEGVALAIWNMLELPFPEEPAANLVRINRRDTRVAWKTGTSTGYHDAWTVAFNRHYVVGAWLGNNDGRPSQHLVGAHVALPLVAHVFRSLPVPPTPEWPQQRPHLREQRVCADTGLPPSPWCPSLVSTWLPRTQYLHRRCDVHRPGAEGTVAAYWPGASHRWDLARVPKETTSHRTTPTTDNKPRQERAATPHRQKHLDIIAPANNATYILTGDDKGDRIRLNTTNNVVPLHWYYNDRYIGRSEQRTPLYLDLAPGEHRVACMDKNGRIATTTFTVLPG